MNIILGSQSPRRKALLGSLTLDFTVIPPGIDEQRLPHEKPLAYTQRVTLEKLQNVVEQIANVHPPALIIAADTIVTIDGQILGKPRDMDHAIAMLSLLSARSHQVITGIALCYKQQTGMKTLSGTETTMVTFKSLTEQEIHAYLNRITFMDKAGGYAFQEHGDMIIESVQGSMSNVIGFPLRLFFRLIGSLQLENEICL